MADHTPSLVVIGAGPGGYAAAFLAADLGMDVTLVDPEANPGGVCLYRGCIPSKALLHVAKVIHESRAAKNWGLNFEEPAIDLHRMRAWKNEVVGKLTGGLGQHSKRRKVTYLRGTARFSDARTVQVRKEGGGQETLAFGSAIIATGSCPGAIPGFPDSPRVLDSTTALELEDVPERLLVIGGGYIGLELGTVYAALGAKVTVVEMLDSLLPGVDADLVRPLARRLEDELEAIHLKTRVASVKETKSGLEVEFESEGGGPPPQVFDRVLVAVGRRPSATDLGLETTRIQPTPEGFIPVDARRRTAEDSIFAIGDVAGQPMLAHKASHEGRTAVEVIRGEDVIFKPAAIPAVVFTDPEIAWAGLTEGEAKAEKRKIEVARFPWAASGRSITLDRTDGVTKLLIDPDTERVLGVGISGPGAGELIAEGVLAIEMAATARDLELTIHPHPTLSETMMFSAEAFFGTATDIYRPKQR
jgi:dihydrolipoamide dehydrogenase